MFRARTITATSTTLKSYFQNALARLNWRPCRDDIECYLALDPTAMNVGLLNEKPIAILSLFKHDEWFHHIGGFVVHEDYQNKGYGWRLHNDILKKSAPIKNLSGYASTNLARKLEKSFNMTSQWYGGSYDISVTTALERLHVSSNITCGSVKPMNKINMRDLFNYDRFVFGYNRETFLEKWLNTPGTHVRVAVNQDGSIIGYVVVRVAFIQDQGYKIGPLFSDNIHVAKAFLLEVFAEIRECGVSSSNSVIADSPIGRNPEAKELMQLIGGEFFGKFELMTSNILPRGRLDDWFVITGLLCG